MTAFVTGATGFIGRNLVLSLARQGRRVLCLVRDPRRAAWMEGVPNLVPVPGSLDDPEVLARCAGESDLVYHLAGSTRAVAGDTLFAVNSAGTARVAAAAAAAATAPAVVYVSSLAASGPGTSRDAAGDDRPPRPVTDYGRSKLLGESLLRERLPGARWTILRPPAVYGPWDRDVLLLFRLASRGIILQVRGAMKEASLVHVDDLVRALLLAGERPEARGKVYHVSDGRPHGRDEIASALRAAVGRGFAVPVPPSLMRLVGLAGDLASLISGRPALLCGDKVREALQEGWVCSSRRIEEELGFVPAVGLDEGFRTTARWYREAGWLR